MLTERIRATEVRLIDGEENIGVVPRREAEEMARERGLDLVIMSLDSSPPVVRMVDFGKFKFEIEKKAKEAKKKQHTIEIKEVKLSIRIDKHDFTVKLSNMARFLQAGNKIKVTIRLKGREIQHADLAYNLAKKVVEDLTPYGAPDAPLRMEGRTLVFIISPGKTAKPPKATKVESAEAELPEVDLPAADPLEVDVPEEETADE